MPAGLFPRTLARVAARRGADAAGVEAARARFTAARRRVRAWRAAFAACALAAAVAAVADLAAVAGGLAVAGLLCAALAGHATRRARAAGAELRAARRLARVGERGTPERSST